MNHNETIEGPMFKTSTLRSGLPKAGQWPNRINSRRAFRKLKHYLSACRQSVSYWFRTMSRTQKWLNPELVWRLKVICRFHSPERFRSLALIGLNRACGKWRLLKLDPAIVHTLFYVCVENTPEGPRVVKLPLCSTENSMKLVNELKDPDGFSRYVKVLTGLTGLPGLGKHCVSVTEIRRNGGYTCEYVDGTNLGEFRYKLFHGNPLTKSERQQLIDALQALKEHVNEYYRQHGEMIGDWSLNNLVFEPTRAVIINVDAEGFYTHSTEKSWWSWQKLQAHLDALGELVRLLDSGSIEQSKMADLFRVRDTVQGIGQAGSSNLVAHGHSLELNCRRFRSRPESPERAAQAQLDFSCRCRSCLSRIFVLDHLAHVPFDFRDKIVLDLGCHMGDVLHALAADIKRGYGFDVDPDCVNAAHLTRSLNHAGNLEFFTFHPKRQDPELLKCFLLRQRVDICFLFATRNWFEQWPEILAEASRLSPAMLFEEEEIPQSSSNQVSLLNRYYTKIELVAEAPDDSGPFSLGIKRRLYLCTERKLLAPDVIGLRSTPLLLQKPAHN